MLRGAVEALLAVVLAPSCAACGEPLESPLAGPVCPACWQDVRPLSSGAGPAASDELVAADYRGALRPIIHAFKYEGRRTLAAPLGRLMAAAAGEALGDAACVVPVPLHPWRRLTRGFNQAADLAVHLGPPVVHALRRTTLTRSQVGLDAAARRRNVREAFAPSLLVRPRQHALIAGRVVMAVDDVRTTGATLRECAAVLRAMGAREVRTLTLAQAPLDDPGGVVARRR